MPRHISLLFPGQGSQSLEMLSSFSNEDINFISEVSNKVLSVDLVNVIQQGSEDKLNQTSLTQPALLATSYLYYKKFVSITGANPNLLAGHSLGEYSALVASGSIDFEDALLLVHKRGLFMEKCDAGSMFAILNLDLETIDSICSEVSSRLNQSISSANINSLNQVVIAGTHEAAQAAADKCKEKGAKRAIQLKVSVASHCELMNQASILLSEELKNTGKPEDIVKKISIGKINKFKEDNALLTQAWVMEPKKKVKDILKDLSIADLKIKDFYRLKIGE